MTALVDPSVDARARAARAGVDAPRIEADAVGALERARDHLLSLQHPDGWWKGELETNVTMDAEDLLLRHFLGILEPGLAAETARWIRGNQRADGTWGTFYGAPPDLSTTIEAYVALRLAGDRPEEPHMTLAAAWVRDRGGIEASRVFTRIWLAVVGRWDWEDLPVVPPEIMFLPPWVPLNVYDFACWARQTIVALTVVMAHRPARPLPFTVDELRAPEAAAGAAADGAGTGRAARRSWWRTPAGRFEALDRALHRYERLPAWVPPRRTVRQAALVKAEQWIVRRQEADGLWGGIQPPVVYSIIALALQGYSLDHPVVRAALAGLDGFVVHDERGRRLEACQSPVWDTALAVVALVDAGADSVVGAGVEGDDPAEVVDVRDSHEEAGSPADSTRLLAGSPADSTRLLAGSPADSTRLLAGSPADSTRLLAGSPADSTRLLAGSPADSTRLALDRATRWLVQEEIRVAGDWVVRRPHLAPGGWAFEFANDNYADVDDTAEVLMALRRARPARGVDRAVDEACARGITWATGMQSRNGAWGAFDADNDSSWVAALPFCDFGEVTDPPSADVTAHMVEMLADEPNTPRAVLERGVRWLWDQQEPDGSWFGRWGVNYVYGTGAVVPALVAAGARPDDPRIRRAVRWLEEHQNPDGGWGEDLRSYVDAEWHGQGESTASQTAWALLALLAAGERDGDAAHRGVAWLVRTQTPEGTWDEPWFTGTGFPWDFSINYHLYRLVFPLTALGRYVHGTGPRGADRP